MLIDAHIHIDSIDTANYLKEKNIACLANAASVKEYELLSKLAKDDPNLYISAGIHPWNVNYITLDDMKDVLDKVKIIGEIGLDNTWCNTDIDTQKYIFEKQLDYASKTHKPVVLHIKGMEKEAIEYIKKYSNKYLVHWYSCDKYLDEYIDLGCFFTVGPSVVHDETVIEVVRKVDLDKMMIETDGINALSWCENREVKLDEYGYFLNRSINEISKIRNISIEDLEKQFELNFYTFKKAI